MIFTSDEVTSENHWQTTSRVTKMSLFTVTNVLFYFLHAIFLSWTHGFAKNNCDRSFRHCCQGRSFSALALWRHHNWTVTSREREMLALWRRLFLHAQIGTKAIFTSDTEDRPRSDSPLAGIVIALAADGLRTRRLNIPSSIKNLHSFWILEWSIVKRVHDAWRMDNQLRSTASKKIK